MGYDRSSNLITVPTSLSPQSLNGVNKKRMKVYDPLDNETLLSTPSRGPELESFFLFVIYFYNFPGPQIQDSDGDSSTYWDPSINWTPRNERVDILP